MRAELALYVFVAQTDLEQPQRTASLQRQCVGYRRVAVRFIPLLVIDQRRQIVQPAPI